MYLIYDQEFAWMHTTHFRKVGYYVHISWLFITLISEYIDDVLSSRILKYGDEVIESLPYH